MYFVWRNTLIYFVFSTFFLLYAQENVTEPLLKSGTKLSKKSKLLKIDPINTNVSHNVTSKIVNDSLITQRMVTYCVTPNGDTGFCMPLMNCTKLMNQLEKNNTKKFLKESMCGPKNENKDNPFVCCGKYVNFKQLEKNPFPKTCGFENVTIRGRILGGKEAKLGEFPWLARLFHKSKGKERVFGCAGFLITSKFVLTAAHCLKSKNNNLLGPVSEVHLGEHDTDTDIDCTSNNKTCADELQTTGIKQIFVHPNYNMDSKDHHHDIGLIQLKKSARNTKYVSPICLVEKLNFEPFEYWLGGWGRTETDSFSHIKMKVSIPPYPHSNCTKKFDFIDVAISDKQLCAGGKKNIDSCTGDSGGPLMLADRNRWFAVGVVSYGLGCGREGWPAVYTNITSYRDWIKNVILDAQKSNDQTKKTHTKN